MAKKKSKSSKSSNMGLILVAVAGVFALAAFAMIFATAFKGKVTEGTFSGLQASFGYSEEIGPVTLKVLSVNALSMIAYLLPLVALVISLVFHKSKLFTLVCAGLYLACAICAFLSILTFPSTVIGSSYVTTEWAMGIGTILSGVFSVLAAAVLGYKAMRK